MLKWTVQLSGKSKVFYWLECYFQRTYTLLGKKACIFDLAQKEYIVSLYICI